MNNGLAALIVGAYLLAVAWRGNTGALVERLKEDRGFVPWALAFVLLWLAYQGTRNKVVLSFMFVALAAFFIQAGAGLFRNFDAVMAKLKG